MEHARTVLQILGALAVLGVLFLGSLWLLLPRRAAPGVERAEQALARVRSQPSLAPGSPEESEALERVRLLFSDLAAPQLGERIEATYASDVYFNDTLVELQGRERIVEYLEEGAEALEEGSVHFFDVARTQEGEVLLRWRMDLTFRSLADGRPTRSLGVSQMRFDTDGRVVFHKDYWDSAGGLFDHVPLVGGALQRIRARL